MVRKLTVMPLLFFGSLLFLTSCQKEQVSPLDQLSDLTREVISKPSLQEMKQGLAMLSTTEREDLWKVKLNFILDNKKEKFTPDQRNIVMEVKDFLQKNGMAKLMADSEIGIRFLDENLPRFSKHFSKEQLNILLESPYLNESLVLSQFNFESMKGLITPRHNADGNPMAAQRLAPEKGSCTCLYDMGCPGGGNNCENTGCVVNDSYEMCGVFGTSSCKKRCSGAEPNLDPDPNGGNPL